MAFDEHLADRITELVGRWTGCERKRMFGGVGFLVFGNMCVGVWKEFLIARVGPDDYADALVEPHVSEFNITGKSMRGWVMVAPEGTESRDQLAAWIERAGRFVRTLPRK